MTPQIPHILRYSTLNDRGVPPLPEGGCSKQLAGTGTFSTDADTHHMRWPRKYLLVKIYSPEVIG
jgi:hypothetical protein